VALKEHLAISIRRVLKAFSCIGYPISACYLDINHTAIWQVFTVSTDESILLELLQQLPVGHFAIVGRFHEAFAAYHMDDELGDDGTCTLRWLVLDSHVRQSGIMNTTKLLSYIFFMRAGDAYSFGVMGAGRSLS
jgi:hypothetical protein